MLEIGFVERARRQHHGQRHIGRLTVGQQARAQTGKKTADGAHAQIFGHLRINARHDLTIFEGITRTRRCLRAITQHPPAAVGTARQIDRIKMQPGAITRTRATARPQVIWMTEHQLRRDAAVGDQLLRAIQIGQHRVEQTGALQHTGFDLPPL